MPSIQITKSAKAKPINSRRNYPQRKTQGKCSQIKGQTKCSQTKPIITLPSSYPSCLCIAQERNMLPHQKLCKLLKLQSPKCHESKSPNLQKLSQRKNPSKVQRSQHKPTTTSKLSSEQDTKAAKPVRKTLCHQISIPATKATKPEKVQAATSATAAKLPLLPPPPMLPLLQTAREVQPTPPSSAQY